MGNAALLTRQLNCSSSSSGSKLAAVVAPEDRTLPHNNQLSELSWPSIARLFQSVVSGGHCCLLVPLGWH